MPQTDPFEYAVYQRQWRERNRAKSVAYSLSYRAKNHEKVKAYQRQYRLRKTCEARGITAEQYTDAMTHQQGKCLLCDEKFGRKRLSIDHNHKTGTFRGLLCIRCNTGLGMFRDNPQLLRTAAQYIEEA